MNRRTAVAAVLGALFTLGFALIISGGLPFVSGPGAASTFEGTGAALWNGRAPEVIFQGFIILSGIISILLLLGPDKSGGREP